MIGLNGVFVVFTDCGKPFFKTMLGKPYCSRIYVRHEGGALNLYELGCVVKMDINSSRKTFEEEVEFKMDLFHDPSSITAGGFDGARQVNTRHHSSEAFIEGGKGWLCYLLVKAWAAMYINIILTWGDLKRDIRIRGII